MTAPLRSAWRALLLLLPFTHAAFISFDNCLDPNILDKLPRQLQWVPLFVDAKFDTSYPNNLQVTYYGNVTGQQNLGTYPPPNSPQWTDPTVTFGKIANVGSGNNFSTLFSTFTVATYTAWDAQPSRFCPHLTQGDCPLGPRFFADPTVPSELAAFTISHDFGSGYQFSTLSSSVSLISGDFAAQQLACINANITPDLGASIKGMLTWLPAAILIFKGVATLVAAIWSPWGSSDVFRWSSNYGRDEDLLRLVTPGFGDCLQYIQFVTLMGSLTLQYPGFFQPAVSETAWSLLLFNESWVTNHPGMQSLVDGIYTVNGTYGISAMHQLIGMYDTVDVWACMAIWLAIIAAIIIFLCQLGFFTRWLHRQLTNTSEEDLRQKNLPFTLGNLIRLLFNFFILPIIALSLFQLVISPRSPTSVVACAAILLAVWIISAAWILRVIFSTKPRTHLFDDMPTVLLYGPLYNTYSDSAAPFAFVPILITFMRGVAFGAVQPSGTAQIIILAICEIILIVTLNGFRPFMNQTSMNAYHTFFAVVRLITVILAVAFIPSIDISESSKDWVGYTILLLHACVLVFGFFLNSAQTIVEVAARSLGLAGHDAQTGQARGSILNWRMLKKRQARPATAERGSMGSNAAMVEADPHRRSLSASSQQLLNQAGGNTPSTHRMSNLDTLSNGGENGDSPRQGFTYVPGSAGPMQGKLDENGAFYRPPRKRTMTNDALNPVVERKSEESPRRTIVGSIARSGTDSPRPPFFRDRADSGAHSVRTDYAVREVDQYYRGPALNDQQTRKLKTGPADPEGTAANAQNWFQGLMAGLPWGKKKEKEAGKGFEVVRSSRMPPEDMQQELEMQEKSPPDGEEEGPYQDSPEMQATAGAEREVDVPETTAVEAPTTRARENFDFGFVGAGQEGAPVLPSAPSIGNRKAMHPGMRAEQPSRRHNPASSAEVGSYDVGLGYITRTSGGEDDEEDDNDRTRFSGPQPPSLGDIDTGGQGLNMPSFSRFQSQKSTYRQDYQPWLQGSQQQDVQPTIPVRSPRRTPSESNTPSQSRLADYFQDSRRGHDTIDSSYGESRGYLGTPEEGEERPQSFVVNSERRAGDGVVRNSFGAEAALRGSEAEIVQGSLQSEGGYLGR